MAPPQAELFASRLMLGPALRAQPDGRLVKLVREGYEAAFEEIVRRYRKPLDRFAAAIVGSRSEDVTQDAFSKALLALRGSEQEIELKPWLYRIVRNTALNDLRDRPAEAEQLGEAIEGGHSAAFEAERREEMNELMGRLQALPEPQRAAIVMRELEGLSHEEIAAALGVSGGAARQAIHRARTSLRNGFGLLVPLPLLRFLSDHADTAGAAAAGAGGTAAAALGGAGAGAALKVGVATVLIAGSVGAGVAVEQSHRGAPEPARAAARTVSDDGSSSRSEDSSGREAEPGDDHGGHGEAEPGDDHGGGPGPSGGRGEDGGGSSGHSGPGPSGGGDDGGSSHSGSSGPSGSEDSTTRSGSNSGPGSGSSGGSTGGSTSSESDISGSSGTSGSGTSGSGTSGSSGGSGTSGSSGSSGSGSSGSGSDDGSGSGS